MKNKARKTVVNVTIMGTLFLSLASLRMSIAADAEKVAAAEQQERINSRAFFRDGTKQSVEAVKRHLEALLKRRIEAIDRSCELSVTQKKRLELAGRGAIRQLFEKRQSTDLGTRSERGREQA